MNLNAEWKQGQLNAEKILQMFFANHVVNFASVFSKPGYDLLRPLGKYVGVTATPDDAQSEEEIFVPCFATEEALKPTIFLL